MAEHSTLFHSFADGNSTEFLRGVPYIPSKDEILKTPFIFLTPIGIAIRVVILGYVAYRSLSRKTLTPSGVVAALITGLIHCLSTSLLYITLSVFFYVSGTICTKFKHNAKEQLFVSIPQEVEGKTEKKQKPVSLRTHVQVLANSLFATILILIKMFAGALPEQLQFVTHLGRYLTVGIVCHYAATTADTWSSELGVLSTSSPFLITSFRKCPTGTNGGVSLLGLVAGFLGGLSIGLVSLPFVSSTFYYVPHRDVTLHSEVGLHLDGGLNALGYTFFIGLMGLFGSILDSVLGAIFQKTVALSSSGKVVEVEGGAKATNKLLTQGDVDLEDVKTVSGTLDLLSNNQVNFLQAAITAVVGGAVYFLLE